MTTIETKREVCSLFSGIISGIAAEKRLCDVALKNKEAGNYLNEILDQRNQLEERLLFYQRLWLSAKDELQQLGVDIEDQPYSMTEQEWIDNFVNKKYEDTMKLRRLAWKPMPFWRVIKDLIVNRY